MTVAEFSISLPNGILESILLETGYVCPIPMCNKEIWDIFTIDQSGTNQDPNNLIGLCATHYSLAASEKITKHMLRSIKKLLTTEPEETPSFKVLRSRKHLLEELANRFSSIQDKDHLRLNYVGPLFLHPNWYHSRRNKLEKGLPNIESPFFDLLKAKSGKAYSNIKVQVRNVPRYAAKVKGLISEKELVEFKNETLENVYAIWGPKLNKGPELVCLETGFYRHPFIFSDSVVEATRVSPDIPTNSGILNSKRDYVIWERKVFDKTFAKNSAGKTRELEKLITFIKSI